ncbi:MAG: tetratricopeptide repeat protein, partial [Myxococcota bacterium]
MAIVTAALALGGVLTLGAANTQAYPAAWRRALALEASGRFAAAAALLEAYADGYPEEYALQLQLGWLHFQAADYGGAEVYYLRARDLSGGASLAQLGLGWTYLRGGRYDEARACFDAVLAQEPGHPSAREGLALLPVRASVQLTPSGGVAVLAYDQHPEKRGALSVNAALTMLVADRVMLAGTVRHTEVLLSDSVSRTAQGAGSGFGASRRAGAASFSQQEVHLSLGLADPLVGAFVQAAHVFESKGELGALDVLGAALRVSTFGDLTLEGSLSRYADGTVLRLAPAWRLPM